MVDISIDELDILLFEKYDKIYNKDEEKKERKKIDEISYGLNNSNINRLPHYNDPNFVFELSRQLQIYHCKSSFNIKELQSKCNIDNFEISNNQQFLKNFINENTPYNGLLIFHGVGVGKTCSAINISSSFINQNKLNNKKIIALVSKNIQQNWQNTIYDPNKIGNQCSEDIKNIIDNEIKDDINKNPSQFKVKQKIKDFYEFYGYLEFSNYIQRLRDIRIGRRDLSKKEKEKILRDVIREYCSDRIMIIDEVHNLREENDDNDKKEKKETARSIIKKIVKYSSGMKLILMSATPMFNKSKEIIWLLNLLLSNDNRPLLKYKDVFESINGEDKLKPIGKLLIKKKCSGYVSYLRGENPISFPIRLYPSDNNLLSKGNNNYPTIELFNNNKISSYNFEFLHMYFNKMDEDGIQLKYYKEYINTLSVNEGEMSISERKVGLQLSNIIYSINEEEDNIKNIYGENGFFNFMNKSNKKYSYKNIEDPIFDINKEYLNSISSKITNILNGMKKNKSKGILFIYSDYIYSGVLPIALALEHMGFEKYNNNNLLDYPEWKKGEDNTKSEPLDFQWNTKDNKTTETFKRAKYIILSGNTDLSPNNNNEINAVKNINNTNGENIKIILGTSVTSEGIDFKNIREIHVLDPWYHLYKTEQIIGRGIRFCSHINLPNEERNVTVYLHTSGESYEKESIDTNTYRMAEQKASQIGEIETILKNNAIDCYLNENINYISDLELFKIRSSRSNKITKINVNDQEYSKVCSFSNNCNINCTINKENLLQLDNIKNNDLLSIDTYSEQNIIDLIKPIIKIIIELYNIYDFYTLQEIITRINETIDTNDFIIYHSIKHMIDYKTPIWNKNNISGYIIQRNQFYIYQPFYNNDIYLPLYNRMSETDNKNNTINLNIYKSFEVNIPDDSYKCVDNYIDIYFKIYTDIFNSTMKGWRDPETKNLVYGEISKLKGNMMFFKNRIQVPLKKLNEINDIIRYSDLLRFIIPNINNQVFINHILDKINYSDKLILMKNILCNVIKNNYKEPNDIYDNYIYKFFKNNIIRINKNGEYSILNEKGGNIIGFFLHNTLKSFKNISKSNLSKFNFFIFIEQSRKWIELDEIGKISIKNNFDKNKSINKFKTSNLWGYSYKNAEETHLFKIIRPTQRSSKDKLPGKVLADVLGFKSISLLEIYKENYPDYFNMFELFILNLLNSSKDKKDKQNSNKYKEIKDETKKCSELYNIADIYFVRNPLYKQLINKNFLIYMGELIMRDLNHKNKGQNYISYDMFLLKFGL